MNRRKFLKIVPPIVGGLVLPLTKSPSPQTPASPPQTPVQTKPISVVPGRGDGRFFCTGVTYPAALFDSQTKNQS